jgi:hypothetical protein
MGARQILTEKLHLVCRIGESFLEDVAFKYLQGQKRVKQTKNEGKTYARCAVGVFVWDVWVEMLSLRLGTQVLEPGEMAGG